MVFLVKCRTPRKLYAEEDVKKHPDFVSLTLQLSKTHEELLKAKEHHGEARLLLKDEEENHKQTINEYELLLKNKYNEYEVSIRDRDKDYELKLRNNNKEHQEKLKQLENDYKRKDDILNALSEEFVRLNEERRELIKQVNELKLSISQKPETDKTRFQEKTNELDKTQETTTSEKISEGNTQFSQFESELQSLQRKYESRESTKQRDGKNMLMHIISV